MKRSIPSQRKNTKGLLLLLFLTIALYAISRKIGLGAGGASPARSVPAGRAGDVVLQPPSSVLGMEWASPSVAAELTPDKNRVEGWGKAINLAEDCTFTAEGGKLAITVPGSARPHGLSSELGSASAPLVVQPVKGNFTIQVRVDGKFQPGDVSTESRRSAYMGAGLVVFADERNYVTIARATLQWPGQEPKPYTNFEIRVNSELEQFGQTDDFPTDPDKPVWLRLERKGEQMLGAMSQDGETWTYGKPKQLSAEAWNQNGMQAGVAAINNSPLMPFTPTYSELSVQEAVKPGTE